MTQVMPLLIPIKCKSVSFKRVYVKTAGGNTKDLKLLFRISQPLDILRFEFLRTDDLPKFLKSAISRVAEIKILSLDFSDRMSAEHADIGQVLLNLRFWNIKQIYLNPIYITQKTDVVTLKKMMKQVKFIDDYEGSYKTVEIPTIQVAECKHQIKFLELLYRLFTQIKRCELIVTDLKYNNFYFDHFFKELTPADRKKLIIEQLTIPNEEDRKNKFALEQIVKNTLSVKSMELRAI